MFGTRGQFLLKSWDEDEPVEAGIISKQIERAQKKVELNHFEGRKHVLQYDDVMNVQREVIYRERRRALQGADIRDTVVDMAQKAAIAEADKNAPRDVRSEEWDTRKLYLGLGKLFGLAALKAQLEEEALEDAQWHELPDNSAGQSVLRFHSQRRAWAERAGRKALSRPRKRAGHGSSSWSRTLAGDAFDRRALDGASGRDGLFARRDLAAGLRATSNRLASIVRKVSSCSRRCWAKSAAK